VAGRQELEPDAFTQRNYNFGGDLVGEQRLIAITNVTFTNFWNSTSR